MLRKRKRMSNQEDDDPMAGIANLSDAMLVLALGFLIFAILALNTNPELIDSSKTQDVSTGETFANESAQSGEVEDSGFSEVGTVYKDPKTGELIMVSN